MREGYIEVKGGRIWYRIVNADAKGAPVVFVHGGPGVPHDMLEPLEKLDAARPLVFYDQLGCGNSDRPSDPALWTRERFVDEFAALRSALGLEEVHVAAFSWGTMLIVDYMLWRKPKGVLSLVMSGPCLSVSRWIADQQDNLAALPEQTRAVIAQKDAAGDYASPEYQAAMMVFYHKYICGLDPWPDYINRAFEKMGLDVYTYMWGPSEFRVTGTLKDYERAEDLKEITVPVLFTCGEYDEAKPETTRYYQERLPGSELAVFKGATHMHAVEKLEEYAAKVTDFIRRAEKKERP